ncbi:hypothetical protein BH10PSE7_BH10PSE7_05100 [soil metagenome]
MVEPNIALKATPGKGDVGGAKLSEDGRAVRIILLLMVFAIMSCAATAMGVSWKTFSTDKLVRFSGD